MPRKTTSRESTVCLPASREASRPAKGAGKRHVRNGLADLADSIQGPIARHGPVPLRGARVRAAARPVARAALHGGIMTKRFGWISMAAFALAAVVGTGAASDRDKDGDKDKDDDM